MSVESHPDGRHYWPFETLPANQQTEQHKQEIRFLDAAHRQGYRAYACASGDLGAMSSERSSLITLRGRKRWELVLGTSDAKLASAFVDDLDCATLAALAWLGGAEAVEILAQVHGHLVRMPGAAHSFVLDPIPMP